MKNLSLDRKAVRAILLFIAELNGFKSGTVKAKAQFGFECYANSTLHDIDLSNPEHHSEAHENMWLERIYTRLDQISKLSQFKLSILKSRLDASTILANLDLSADWQIPIELDASASMLGYMGALLGESRLLTEVNMHGKTLSDPWNRGMDRTKFKHAATPSLYGSSQPCHILWQNKGHKYSMEDVHAYNQQLTTGSLGVANQFKEFLIHNCKPKATMQVKIWKDEFTIECNRFINKGETTKRYKLYDSITGHNRTIKHTDTVRVPDLNQFRRYFVTLLIHNLDSQVADRVAEKLMDKYGWTIDIHDAFLVHPRAAADCRKWYAQEIDELYANRHQILADYFQSIGIGPEAQTKWDTVKSMIQPVESFKCRRMALK